MKRNWTPKQPDKTTQDKAYVNVRLLDPASNLDIVCDSTGGLITRGEKVSKIGPKIFENGISDDIEVIDCLGHCLVPGLVDIRVQVGEPGYEHKETIESVGLSATAGGVTTIVCLPNTKPIIADASQVEFLARRARKIGLTKIYPYAALTANLEGKKLTEIGLLAEAGAVAFTDGDKAIENAQVLRRALSYALTFDLLIIQHPEEPSLVPNGGMTAGETATRLGLPGIPREAEIIMIERDIRLVEMTGGKLHFAHISTSESVSVIRKAKEKGLKVTCDTAPPYFALNDQTIGEYRTFAKLSPPLRSENDRKAIVAGLEDDTIDAIASDHSPQDADSKRLPFTQAESGGVGLETLLSVSLDLYHNGNLSLLKVLEKITNRPAELLNLPAGKIEEGSAADLVIFDPDFGWQVKDTDLASKSKNTPFDLRLVQGIVRRTIIDGRMVYKSEDE